MKNKSVTVVSIPLVCYHGEILWGIYQDYSGRRRQEIKWRSIAGKQVLESFIVAIQRKTDVAFVVDEVTDIYQFVFFCRGIAVTFDDCTRDNAYINVSAIYPLRA